MALQTATAATFEDHRIPLPDIESFRSIFEYLQLAWSEIEAVNPSERDERVRFLDDRFTWRENQISMAVKLLHANSVMIVERHVDRLLDEFHLDPSKTVFAMSGGFGLNCPTNCHVLNRYKFADFRAPPCVNDAGISLGAALYYFWRSDPGCAFLLDRVDYGPGFDVDWLSGLYPNVRERIVVSAFDAEQFVEDICAGPIIWFDGGSELGPRALGHRSLLGDPRTERTKAVLNRIKGREWWRPVAPVVLEEAASEWFRDCRMSPYMLLTADVQPSKREHIPAVLHLDGTARVQTASEARLPRLYRALVAFGNATGVPMLANTSLNVRGEPIIATVSRAISFAFEVGIQTLYVHGQRVQLLHGNQVTEVGPSSARPLAYYATPPDKRDAEFLDSANPHGLSIEVLQLYCRLPILRELFDIESLEDATALEAVCSELLAARPLDCGTSAHSTYLIRLRELLRGRPGSERIVEH